MNAAPTGNSATAPRDAGAVPGNAATMWTLAGVTLARLGRGKALWIGVLLAALPIPFASFMRSYHVALSHDDAFFVIWRLLLALLSAMFVASSIGEEMENRTGTYLWSRPIARWTVLAGKLCALVPIVLALIVASWYASIEVWTAAGPAAVSCLALAVAGAAACIAAAGVATLVPKYAMALTIGYLLLDNFIAALPFSVRELTIAHQTSALAGLADDAAVATPLIGLVAIAGVWGVVGFLRIRRLEV
jgi:ABC-type transport system involved in multi-copper enzyme maturation permease subunit